MHAACQVKVFFFFFSIDLFSFKFDSLASPCAYDILGWEKFKVLIGEGRLNYVLVIDYTSGTSCLKLDKRS